MVCQRHHLRSPGLGLSGSPTKVKNIESVVFQAKEAKVLEPSDTAIDEMMKELIVNHTVG